ncbi:hypothetical protein FB639_002836 [Coemansia asiatica]|nr:hypothetical protein FB639_002836 [Coemansia asiatica]
MTKRVEGLVQMIETMEAFWKFSRKFPNGPVSARHTADSEGQLMSLAMLWTGAARSSPRNKLIEFLAHDSYCQAARAKTTARVLTLEKILQRLKKRLGSLKQNDYLKDNSNSSSSVGAGSTEVVADGVSSADLQLQAVPLIGRLVVSERGELFLWDSTGHLLVHPSFVSGISHPNRAFSYKDPVFAGQMLIGHLYAWNNWRFMIETIDVMSIGKIGDEARISRSGPSPDFRLVYAAISNPVVLIADPTFGGLVASSGRSLNVQELSESDISLGSVMQEREQEQEQPLCLVLFVHWQGMAAPTASQEMQQATKQGCADGSGWRARVAVRGASLKIDYSSFKDQLQNAMDDKPQINIDLSKNGALGNQWESCFIHFTPSKVPAKFASNCAYVICVSKKSRSGYLMSDQRASQNLFFVKLGSLDRVYPVHLSINGQQADTGIPPIAKQLPVATINVLDQRVNSNPISRLHAPRSFSIKEIHDALVSEAATTGSGIAGRLISVYGIVVRRKVRDAVEFVRTNSDNNRDMQSNPLVAGMFENVIVLSDESDMSLTITLYIKLYTFAHPLGLLPGACIEFQNLTVGVSKTSSQIYLTSTNLTTIQHVPAQPIGSTIISSKQQANAGPESKPSRILNVHVELLCRQSPGTVSSFGNKIRRQHTRFIHN